MAYYSLNNKYGKFRNQEKLLNNCIDSKLQVSMMVDDWIGMATCIIGNNGLVVKLKSYILRDLPLFIRHYNLSNWKLVDMETIRCSRIQSAIKKNDIQVTKLFVDSVIPS